MSAHACPPAYIDDFVDDFLGLAQGNHRRRQGVRALPEALDTVIRPLSATDRPEHLEPASVKKLGKGDGAWAPPKQTCSAG